MATRGTAVIIIITGSGFIRAGSQLYRQDFSEPVKAGMVCSAEEAPITVCGGSN